MLGRKVELRFNKVSLDKDIARQIKNYSYSDRQVEVGDRVYLRDYSRPNRKS